MAKAQQPRIRGESCLCFCLYTNLILSHLRSCPISRFTHTHTNSYSHITQTNHTACLYAKPLYELLESETNEVDAIKIGHFCVFLSPHTRTHHFISPFWWQFEPEHKVHCNFHHCDIFNVLNELIASNKMNKMNALGV